MPKHPTSILIFAAGFGTRMGALTTHRPKPLVPVAGMPMIDRAIDLARNASIPNITANLHYKHEMLTQHLSGQGVNFSIESPLILDTGGGLRQALSQTGTGPVYTLNPDAIWLGGNPLSMLANAWNPMKMDALLMLIPRQNAIKHTGDGDFQIGPSGKLDRGPGLVYSGAQIIKTALLENIPETVFSLNLVWDQMAAKNSLFGISYAGKWCDVGTPQGVTIAGNLLRTSDV